MPRLPLLLLCACLGASTLAWAEAPAPVPPVAEAAKPTADAVKPAEAPPVAAPKLEVDGARLPEPEIPRSEPPELAAGELDLGFTLFRTLVVLAMVVALAYLTLNVGLRRLLGIRAPTGASVVTVLERVALDQKRSLFVVEAAGEVLLIGGGDSQLSLITKLDRAALDQARAAEGPPSAGVQLSPFLQKLLGKKDSPPQPPPPAA